MTVDPLPVGEDADLDDVPVRDASTVVLLRDGADGLEVWLQQRSPHLVFAAGLHAFPGGAVDEVDRVSRIAGFDAGQHAAVWSCDEGQACALANAAVRETHEEADVLLSPPLLHPWSRWITPPGPPRRFDAHFFVAALPPAAVPRACTGEVHDAAWVSVQAAVERHAVGDLPMWPPTITTLTQLLPHDSVEAVLLAAPTAIEAVTE